jgi:hypothetical protein
VLSGHVTARRPLRRAGAKIGLLARLMEHCERSLARGGAADFVSRRRVVGAFVGLPKAPWASPHLSRRRHASWRTGARENTFRADQDRESDGERSCHPLPPRLSLFFPQTAGRPAQTICLINRHFREAIDKSRQLDLLAGKG